MGFCTDHTSGEQLHRYPAGSSFLRHAASSTLYDFEELE